MTRPTPANLVLSGDPPERDVQADTLAYLRTLPKCHAWRANSGAVRVGGRFIRMNEPGCADVLCCYRGLFVGIEIKRRGGKLRPEQEVWRDKIEAAGGVYLRAESWTDVRDLFSRIDMEAA